MGNSVIYRPAYDAEVEYLESDGNSYIDTGLKASSELGILAHIYLPSAGIFPFGGRNGLTNKEFSFISRQSDFTAGFRFGSSESTNQLDLGEIYEFDNKQSHNTLKVNNLIFTSTSSTFISDYNLVLFGLNHAGTVNQSSGVRIYDFKIYQNSTLVRDFIPVRIGQVGYMYDKVSKQLFANKGTGNFILGNDVSNAVIPQQRCVLYFGNQRSVGFERIYEEYEWLGTDSGSPRIILQEGYNTDENAFIETTYKCQYQNPNVDMVIGFGITGSNAGIRVFNASSSVVVIDVHRRTNGTHTAKRIYGHNGQIGVPRYLYVSLTEYRVDDISGSITLNENFDENVGVGASFIYTNDHSNDVWYKETKLRANNITYDLIPCKLLQSIPAILDGNGIARQAGECGMWDKVSNKFYGNVASSGTFTVKGPKCYEEYKWLKAEIPIRVAMMSLPINSSTFNCTIEHTGAQANLPHLYSDGYIYYTESSNMDMIAVWNVSEANIPFSASVGSLMIIESNEEYFKVNNIRITKYGFPILRMVIQSSYNSNNATTTKTSKITVDGIERYVPCKLTHGIPASMDANGIARPAGTCGMWDKVNDKFYGNVANSGSFTVSND